MTSNWFSREQNRCYIVHSFYMFEVSWRVPFTNPFLFGFKKHRELWNVTKQVKHNSPKRSCTWNVYRNFNIPILRSRVCTHFMCVFTCFIQKVQPWCTKLLLTTPCNTLFLIAYSVQSIPRKTDNRCVIQSSYLQN